MKTVVRFLLAAGMVFTAVFLAASCDDNDHKDDQKDIIGTWNLDRTKVTVDRTADATMTEEELEAALAQYIYFPVNSKVQFTNTNVSLKLELNGEALQPASLPYVLNKGVLTITLPISNPNSIQGSVDIDDDRNLDITLASESYTTLIKSLAESDSEFKKITDQIASASAKYYFSRVK